MLKSTQNYVIGGQGFANGGGFGQRVPCFSASGDTKGRPTSGDQRVGSYGLCAQKSVKLALLRCFADEYKPQHEIYWSIGTSDLLILSFPKEVTSQPEYGKT